MAKAKQSGISMSKPLGEEFRLDTEFALIAAQQNLEIDQIEWSITETETEHTLTGVAK